MPCMNKDSVSLYALWCPQSLAHRRCIMGFYWVNKLESASWWETISNFLVSEQERGSCTCRPSGRCVTVYRKLSWPCGGHWYRETNRVRACHTVLQVIIDRQQAQTFPSGPLWEGAAVVSAHHLIEESQPLLCDAIMQHTHSDMHKVEEEKRGNFTLIQV